MAFPFVAVISAVSQVFGWGKDLVAGYVEKKARLAEAELDYKVKEMQARSEIALYKVKADVEWDLKWADAAQHSWKDEWLLILWSIPLCGLFIPPLRPYIIEGFEYLKAFNPDAPGWYMAGWSIIFAATFGVKNAIKFMAPGRIANLVSTIANAPDDVPEAALEEIRGKNATSQSTGDDARKPQGNWKGAPK